jgi:hypothetical protein
MKNKYKTTFKQEPILETEDLIEQAFEVYFLEYKRNGINPTQPSAVTSTVGQKYVYIRSGDRLLALYNFRTKTLKN